MKCRGNEDSFENMFLKLTHLYYKRAFAILKETEIHPRQIPLVGLVAQQEGISQKEISRILGISAPTVAVSIKRLEKAGLIERKTDEKDQRMSRIYLTDQGKEITGKAKLCIRQTEETLYRGFTESELCLMKRFLRQMIENLEQEGERPDLSGKI